MTVLAGAGLISAGIAADPIPAPVPVFESTPLEFVPTPMSESSPAELRALLDAPTPWRKLVTDLRPRMPVKSVAHLTIIEPNPDLQYSMPIVTPDPSVDYKLHVLEVSPGAPDENAK